MKSPILKAALVQEAFSMEEKHDVIAPVFKTKPASINKPAFSPHPAAKIGIENIQLTILKGANSSLAAEIIKTVVRYAH